MCIRDRASIMSIVFKYADDKGLPLIDLDDLKKTPVSYTHLDVYKRQIKN